MWVIGIYLEFVICDLEFLGSIILLAAMDFFDPEKQKRHTIRLAIVYALIGTALVLATVVLLYRAYGFGLDKEGRIIQNGLVFVSTRPADAQVYLNNKLYKDRTNTRLDIPSGQYALELKRQGYHTWKRALTVEGGSVERFDYPLLFPTKLTTTTTKAYTATPGLVTQSPDHRWLLAGLADQNMFDLFDLNAKAPLAAPVAVPLDILAAGSTTKGWEVVEWARDNRHVLLKRLYEAPGQSAAEYIMFDREEPEASQNLSILLGFTPTKIELRNQAYDQYYLFDQPSGQVFTANLRRPTPQPLAAGVLDFTTEGDRLVFVSSSGAAAGKVAVRIQENDDPALTMRQIPASDRYLLDAAVYAGDVYVAAGSATDNRVSVYKDPVGRLKDAPNEPLVPLQVLKVTAPTHLSFSPNKRFVITENGNTFAVYDAETDRSYAYQVKLAPDASGAHATWLDGFRLTYVSGGKTAVFDYDGNNLHSLVAASPTHLPAIDRTQRFLYVLNPQNTLTSTALLIPEDL
jgi:hypothetical protein